MHLLFVQPPETSPHAREVVATVADVSTALREAGHQVTILTTPREHDAQALEKREREQLREQIAVVHASTPIDLIEWPDVGGLFLEPIDGVADIVRLYGTAGAGRGARGGVVANERELAELTTLMRIPRWIGTSQFGADETRSYAGLSDVHVSVTPPLVDLARWTIPSSPAARDTVLFIEDDGESADTELLAEAFDSLSSAHPNCRRTPVADPHLAAAMQEAAVVVVTSVGYAASRLLLAAQACGAPVVGATRGTARDVVRHGATGLLADVTRADDIVRQIQTLLKNARLREKLSTAALARLHEDFAAERAATLTVSCYEQTISARRKGVSQEASWKPDRDGLVFASSHSRTGYGIVGAHLLRALQRRGAQVAFQPIGPLNPAIVDNPKLDSAISRRTAVSEDAPSVRLSQQFDLRTHVGRGVRVGFTIFERDAFTPDELEQLRAQDALIVCSEWARQVCQRQGISAPIHVVPLGVDRTIFHEHVVPSAVVPAANASDTVFMQVGKLEARKGQFELLCAFEAAFAPADAVQLVLHCHNPFITPADFDLLAEPYRQSPMRDRITLLNTELPTAHDVASLMARATCGVFPVRAEGWNLEALEMLSLGKPVIATYVTAHTEFLSHRNARLIRIDRLEPALLGTLPGAWAAWDVSQHLQLVEHLQSIHNEHQRGALEVNAAGIETAMAFNWDASAEALCNAVAATVTDA